MKNIKLGDQIYEGVETVRLDTAEGGTVDYAPYEETFDAGRTEGYNAGKEAGLEEGFDNGKAAGIEEGIQAEYDRFWDVFLRPNEWNPPGSKMNCNGMFQGFGWKDSIFRPKYILRPVQAGNMFSYSRITDLAGILEECGSGLDTTECTVFGNMFTYSAITRIPEISVMVPANETVCDAMFHSCANLQEIRKIVIGEGKTVLFASAFTNCTSLTTIAFEGEITRAINFQWSPLSVASMKSVITHLKNYAGTADGAKYKVTFTDACWAALEADSSAPDGNTWRDYVETTLGWLT